MPAQQALPEPRPNSAIPVWMRKGTLWTILVLSTIASALIAYYLLPGWWAALVNHWVGASTPWMTGLTLGFTLVLVGTTAFRIALKIPAEAARTAAGVARLLLGIISAVTFVAVTLTVFIAMGISEPLAQAHQLWHHHAPGLLPATLVGALVAIILMLTAALALKRRVPKERLILQEDPARAEPLADEELPAEDSHGRTDTQE